MKIVACIEARYSSTRLPGKMLADIEGKPLLVRVIDRVKKSKNVDEIIIATSTNILDKKISDIAKSSNVKYFTGSEFDVLDRVVQANKSVKADVVVEICGDCPLIDPILIDKAIQTFLENDYDIVCTGGLTQTFPQGTEIMILKSSLLEKSLQLSEEGPHREHVGLFFLENSFHYKIKNLIAPKSQTKPNFRLQVDYEEDLEFVRQIYSNILPICGDNFFLDEIICLLKKKPSLLEINKNCREKPVR